MFNSKPLRIVIWGRLQLKWMLTSCIWENCLACWNNAGQITPGWHNIDFTVICYIWLHRSCYHSIPRVFWTNHAKEQEYYRQGTANNWNNVCRNAFFVGSLSMTVPDKFWQIGLFTCHSYQRVVIKKARKILYAHAMLLAHASYRETIPSLCCHDYRTGIKNLI